MTDFLNACPGSKMLTYLQKQPIHGLHQSRNVSAQNTLWCTEPCPPIKNFKRATAIAIKAIKVVSLCGGGGVHDRACRRRRFARRVHAAERGLAGARCHADARRGGCGGVALALQ